MIWIYYYSQLSITQTLWGTRGLLGTKMKIVRDSKSSSYRIGVSIGIALKGPVKRVRHNESLTVSCIELDLSSIGVIKSQLYLFKRNWIRLRFG